MLASNRSPRSNRLLPERSLPAAATLLGQRCSSTIAHWSSAVAALLTASHVHAGDNASPLLTPVSGLVRNERFTTSYKVLPSAAPCTL